MNVNELYQRGNVNVHRYEKQNVVIYEDHRYILNVLYYLKHKGYLTTPYNLIYFDYHDDALSPTKPLLAKIKDFVINPPSLQDFWQFVEFDLRSMDDDWLFAGMELGLINNAVLIGGVDTTNLSSDVTIYNDHAKVTHKIYSISHLWHSLGVRGELGDSVLRGSFTEIREIFGYNTEGHYQRFTDVPVPPFILDFDCDVFSLDILGKTKAWPRRRIWELFSERSSEYFTSRQFVQRLVHRAQIVTICKESGCCGGYKESDKILRNITELFFEGQLE